MDLKVLTPWYWTSRTIWFRKDTLTQNSSIFFKCLDVFCWYLSVVSWECSEYLWYVFVKGLRWQVSFKMQSSHQRGFFLEAPVDSSTSQLVFSRFLKQFSAICVHVREVRLIDAPRSIRQIDPQICMFPTFLCHFLWRRARSKVFGGKLEQVSMLPTVQAVSLWLVWVLRKKTANVSPLLSENSTFWSMVWKTIRLRIVIFECGIVWKCLFLLVTSQCSILHLFLLKKGIFRVKVAKTSFSAILALFLVRAWALYVLPTKIVKMDGKQLNITRVLLSKVTITRKAVGVLFETLFVENIRQKW